MTRCPWARSELAIAYHDEEWGRPVHDDRVFFEFLVLEAAQAGLSWETILKRRESYRTAFDQFDAVKVAGYGPEQRERLLLDEGIIRNRLKVAAAVQNAKAFLQIQTKLGSFDSYVWQFVGGAPKVNSWIAPSDVPAETTESAALSKDLRKRGFSFVGSTICYAFMQATGLVDDHLMSCYRRVGEPANETPSVGSFESS